MAARAIGVPVREAECDALLIEGTDKVQIHSYALFVQISYPLIAKTGSESRSNSILAACRIILTVERQSILNSGNAFIRIPVNGAILPEA
jgi:hypothetical protein